MIRDLSGETFGKLKVLEYAGIKIIGKNKKSSWKCLCECGKEVIVLGNSLVRGNTKTCGCSRKSMLAERNKKLSIQNVKNIAGKTFGRWKVIKYIKSTNRQAIWLCKCECGNEKEVPGATLRKGQSRSCGCLSRTLNGLSTNKKEYRKYRNQNPINRLRNNVSRLVNHALHGRKNGKSVFQHLPYTFQQLKEHLEKHFEPWMSWENYGGRTDGTRKTWQVDHIIPHSSFNYISLEDTAFKDCWALSNLRPLEKIENMIKGNR